MHDIATRIGMRQPSLYTYFSSKHAIYDAMFAQGWQAWLDRLNGLDLPPDARGALRLSLGAFVEFGLEDSSRFQLMCERPIPGFLPSPAAYAPAVSRRWNRSRPCSFATALPRPKPPDVATALTTGLVSQQIANDPGGDRWAKLVNHVVDMFAGHLQHTQDGGQS
jgi:AcrR family transcriptional regulator